MVQATATKKVKNYKFPKSMGLCADKLYQLKPKIKAANATLDELKREEIALKEHIIDRLPKSQASGISGKIANTRVNRKAVPQVKDWTKFYKYLKKTGNFFMLQKRLSNAAIEEVWDNGKKVPGVESFDVISVSCTKL